MFIIYIVHNLKYIMVFLFLNNSDYIKILYIFITLYINYNYNILIYSQSLINYRYNLSII